MKILLINKFLYPKGGAAISTLTTGNLLQQKGHEVFFWGMDHPKNPSYPHSEYFVSYVDYNKPQSVSGKFKSAVNLLYSFEAKEKMAAYLNIVRPDIVHLNNFAHQISPSILDVFAKYKIPTVMTIRDYKLVCASCGLLAKGKPCEKCRGGKYYWCFFSRCTKGSYFKSLLSTVEMYLHHPILHIYNKIDTLISPSRFFQSKLQEMGLNRKITYLSNFVGAEDFTPSNEELDNSFVFFGRLSGNKGLFTLLKAIKGLKTNLKIIGDGLLKEELRQIVERDKLANVSFLGHLTGEALQKEIRNSIAVIVPSECYENNPRTVLEAFALGKPVIGSKIGGIPELIKDGETGLVFEPWNEQALREKIIYLQKSPSLSKDLGESARKFLIKNFNQEQHYQRLMKIYQKCINKTHERQRQN